MALIDKVKLNLRIDSAVFDEYEFEMLIAAAKADLYHSGVRMERAEDDSDPIIERAVVLYCKAGFGQDPDTQEKWRRAYESYKNSLALSLDYGETGAD